MLRRPFDRYLSSPLAFVCLLGCASVATAQPVIPIGADFQVNSTTLMAQKNADVALKPDGSFVVVWEHTEYVDRGSLDVRRVRGRRFDSLGLPDGDDFEVSTEIDEDAESPALAMADDGRFLVVWEAGTGTSARVRGRLYAADGTETGSELEIDRPAGTVDYAPAAEMATDGSFRLAWIRVPIQDPDTVSLSGGGDNQVVTRRFDSSGSPLGIERSVATASEDNESFDRLRVAESSDGGAAVVAWRRLVNPPSGSLESDVRARTLDSAGVPVGDELNVNEYTTGLQNLLDVAALPDGDFVVSWGGATATRPEYGGGATARIRAETSEVAPELELYSFQPVGIGVAPSGDRAIVGRHAVYPDRIAGRMFLPEGDFHGPVFAVDSWTTGGQRIPAISGVIENPVGSGIGEFVVVWTAHYGRDGDDRGIFARRYLTGLTLFADGFESGDLSAWQ